VTASVLRRELSLLRPIRWWLAASVLLGFLAIASSVGLMAVSAYLISRAALVTNVAEVALAITSVRVLAISRAAFRYLERYVTHRATLRLLAHLRSWVYLSVEPLAPALLDDHRSGDLVARVTADIDTLEDLPVRVLAPPLVAGLAGGFTALLLGSFEPILGVMLLLFMLLAGVLLPVTSRWLSRQSAALIIAGRGELHALLVDEIQGSGDLLALDQAGTHRQQVLDVARRVDAAAERLALVRGVGFGLSTLIASLCGIVLLAIAVPLVASSRLDGVFLALVPLAAIAAFEATQPLGQAVQLLDGAGTAGQRLFQLVDSPRVVRNPPMAAATPTRHDIEVRDLSFRYGAHEPQVLVGLDLSIPDRSSLALVGPSGGGKSTLVDLLLRFRDYPTGEIRIGGRELHDLRADDVQALIGVVPQQVHLFNATVRDNVAVADAGASDEAIEAACRMAQIHDVIVALPEGYDTVVGENGSRLSGGERQQIGIARAVLKSAPILVLDEATANMDVATEERVMDALAPFMSTRTTLIVTHRSAVAARANRVQVLDLHAEPTIAG
jgi:ATP-binding cassette subfamily C protein CydC